MQPEQKGRAATRPVLFTGILACTVLTTTGLAAEPLATRHVVLITLDGVRIQEVFAGMDPVIAADAEGSGIYDPEVTRERYWRETPEARREALLPFFWQQLAPQGMVLGNESRGSRVTVQNGELFSYPGYSEILTGRPNPEVRSNDFVRYPRQTVLDYLQRKLDLPKTAVAQFGSWDGFKMAASRSDGTFFMNGAFEPVPPELATPDLDRVSELRTQVMQLWEESSNDILTFHLALGYLQRHRPRMLWLGMGQSDDWAHARRYDLLLDYLHLVDRRLEELWTKLQAIEGYRDRTTLILTTDHGRGLTPEDWVEHGAGIRGSEDIWIAVIGPDTPDRGEVGPFPTVHQGDVAATILQFFGLDHRAFSAEARPPLPGTLGD